jgi:hypothetical protein
VFYSNAIKDTKSVYLIYWGCYAAETLAHYCMKVAAYLSTMRVWESTQLFKNTANKPELNPNWGEHPDSATTSSHLFKKVAKFVLLRISQTV